MNIRPIEEKDIPAIREAYEKAGYEFDFPDFNSPFMEEHYLVEDVSGKVILAGYTKRTVENITIYADARPEIKLQAITLLHGTVRESLRRKGYTDGFAVVAPKFSAYVRHMVRKFGWKKDYTAYRIGV